MTTETDALTLKVSAKYTRTTIRHNDTTSTYLRAVGLAADGAKNLRSIVGWGVRATFGTPLPFHKLRLHTYANRYKSHFVS